MLGLTLIALDLLLPRERKSLLPYVALVGLIIAAGFTLALSGQQGVSFGGALIVDHLSIFFRLLFLAGTALVVLASIDYVRYTGLPAGEYYASIIFAAIGMMLLASSRELITIYISLELTTIALCILTCLLKRDVKSTEAGLKYILLGALSSAALLYGMALVYGLSGSTILDDIRTALVTTGEEPALILALVFLVAGFGFKMASVPFHMWVPDVYEGAPTPVTAFLSVGSKAAGFVIVLRVFTTAFPAMQGIWLPLFAILAAVTMTLGNVVALRQTNIKRMLGYSSIAQAGYAMVGLSALSPSVTASLLFFLLAYTLTNLGAFIAVIAFSAQAGGDEIEDYNGLAKRAPLLAFGLTLCLLSLTGIPPMAGFTSKLYLFAEALGHGLSWLVVLGLLNSVVSMYYYLRVVRTMYVNVPVVEGMVYVSPPFRLAMWVAIGGMLLLGLYPAPFMEGAKSAVQALLLLAIQA